MNIYSASAAVDKTESQAPFDQRPRQAYIPPAILYHEEMEVIAGSCASNDAGCGQEQIT